MGEQKMQNLNEKLVNTTNITTIAEIYANVYYFPYYSI